MNQMGWRIACVVLLLSAAARAEDGQEFFEKHIRPVLVEKCFKCHSAEAKKLKGGLKLDTREAVLRGGDNGPAVVPGDLEKSLLIKAVRYGDPDLQMPPKERLSDPVVKDLEQWVRSGAVYPGTANAKKVEEKWWAVQPVKRPLLPDVKNRAWAKSPIDRLILAKLEEKGLHPAPEAGRQTLIRRATFDLLGIPPTPAEVDAFVNDSSPNAWEKLIDRLLASPLYGQRWARHWLDLVRYTDSYDSRGQGGAKDCSEAWRYRDWVVDAFNHNLPYDQFIREQLAGDLMGDVVPTGVYAIGNWGGGDADKEKLLTDIVDDQIDLTGRVFLGVTLACARCHDHKFDPITTEDYYGLAGIFFSSHMLPNVGPKTDGPDMLRIPLVSKEELALRQKQESRAKELEAAIAKAEGSLLARTVVNGDHKEVSGWGSDKTPIVLANRSTDTFQLGTITLPGRVVTMHPSPSAAMGAVWRSPIAGRVAIRGMVKDADDKCGNGIDWAIKAGGKSIATGSIVNGGSQQFALAAVAVKLGEELELSIGPKGDYSCDTTIVQWTIRELGGEEREWDLTRDVVNDIGRGNPHRDSLGNEGIWAFYDLGKPRGMAIPPGDLARLQKDLNQLKAILAKPVPQAHGLQEGGCPGSPQAGIHDVKVHIRGRYDRLGALVHRRFPIVIAGKDQPVIGTLESGRMELANWLSSPRNPLTARVMVNRLWQHHFGQGIVRTPNNFGKLGTLPTHPELLDYLASEFVARGWSIKAMQREIMLSAAYRQASEGESTRADPDNLLFGRMNRQRLDAEEMRDALLAVAGKLDVSPGGPAMKELSSPRRTLYLMTVRSDRSSYRMLFDAADPTAIIDQRIDSTVAPQALFLMNHPFMLEQATAVAQRIEGEAREEKDRIEKLYRLLYSRVPREEEVEIGREVIRQAGWEAYCQVLLCANEFVYVD